MSQQTHVIKDNQQIPGEQCHICGKWRNAKTHEPLPEETTFGDLEGPWGLYTCNECKQKAKGE